MTPLPLPLLLLTLCAAMVSAMVRYPRQFPTVPNNMNMNMNAGMPNLNMITSAGVPNYGNPYMNTGLAMPNNMNMNLGAAVPNMNMMNAAGVPNMNMNMNFGGNAQCLPTGASCSAQGGMKCCPGNECKVGHIQQLGFRCAVINLRGR